MQTPTQKGFVLIEVMIAVCIIGIAFMPLLMMYMNGVSSANASAAYTVAANLAQKQFELLKTKDKNFWTQYGADLNIPWQDYSQANPIIINSVPFTIVTRSEASDVDDQLIKVTVSVNWHENNKEQTQQFIRLYDKNP